jgi:hypothetical protein
VHIHTIAPDFQAKQLSFFEENNPRSLVNLVPPSVARQLRLLNEGPDSMLLGLSEFDLWKELRTRNRLPQAVDNMLRVRFWLEYDRVQANGEDKMIMAYVLGRLIANETFYKFYIVDPRRLAWLCCPMVDYQSAMQECLSFGVMRIRQLFEDTDFNAKDGGRKFERFIMMFRMMDERLNGALKVTKHNRAPGDAAVGPVRDEERVDVEVAIASDIDEEIRIRRERIEKLREKKLAEKKEDTNDGRL